MKNMFPFVQSSKNIYIYTHTLIKAKVTPGESCTGKLHLVDKENRICYKLHSKSIS